MTLAALALGVAAAADVRIAVVATRNEGLPHEEPLRYADVDGQRIWRVLVELGAFAPEHVHVVPAASIDAISAALGRAVVAASEAQAAGHDVSLLVYYTGHAGLDGLHLGEEVWSLAELKAAARVVPADERIFVVDACQSGQLFRSQGARLDAVADRPPDFTPPADEAWVTSSGPEERAFEVEERRGALFTHYFVSGARGAADADADRRVTLGELYAFAHRQTTAAAADLGLVQQPRWAGALASYALTDLERASAGLETVGPVVSPILVVRADTGDVAGEIPAGAGGRMALDPGEYQLVAIDRNPRPRVGRVAIAAREWRTVDLGRELVQVRGVRTKGGLVDDRPGAVAGGADGGVGALPGAALGVGGWIGARSSLGRGHHLTVGVAVARGTVRVGTLGGTALAVTGLAQWRYDLVWRGCRAGPALDGRAGFVEQRVGRARDPVWGEWYGTARGASDVRAPLLAIAPGVAAAVPIGRTWLVAFAGAGARAALATPVADGAWGSLRLGVEAPW